MQYEALITDTIQESPDVTTLVFSVDGRTLPFTAGQYTTVRLAVDGGVVVGKAYSLSSIPSDSHMSITVKRLGDFSSRLCDMKTGDTLTITKPYGFFNAQTSAPIVAIAGGVGISPIWSIIRDEISRAPEKEISLLHTGQKSSDLIFREKVTQLFAGHPHAVAHHFVTRDADSDAHSRRLSVENDMTKNQRDTADFYLCGSETFVRGVYQSLAQAEVDERRIHTEIFFESAP